MNFKITNVSLFLQEKKDGSEPFVSVNGYAEVNGKIVAVDCTTSTNAVEPLLIFDKEGNAMSKQVESNKCGPRFHLSCTPNSSILLEGAAEGATRKVTIKGKDGKPDTVKDVTALEHGVAIAQPGSQLRRLTLAARTPTIQEPTI